MLIKLSKAVGRKHHYALVEQCWVARIYLDGATFAGSRDKRSTRGEWTVRMRTNLLRYSIHGTTVASMPSMIALSMPSSYTCHHGLHTTNTPCWMLSIHDYVMVCLVCTPSMSSLQWRLA